MTPLAIGLHIRSAEKHRRDGDTAAAASCAMVAHEEIAKAGPDVVITEGRAALGRTPSERERGAIRLAIDLAREMRAEKRSVAA